MFFKMSFAYDSFLNYKMDPSDANSTQVITGRMIASKDHQSTCKVFYVSLARLLCFKITVMVRSVFMHAAL